ncbi:hypothetical protein JB92DRAFT_3149787 [Gautieria morchelliformis]|nr:hypothetical protein JB92DRAFT_3149787 [Gautieria morchelliformis]
MSATSPRRSRSQSTSMSYETSPTHPSSKRAFSAAASPRNIGHRGKRARRGDSPSPRSPPTVNPLDPLSTAPTPAPLTTVFTNLASSAPATPLLPSSASAFFPHESSCTSHNGFHVQSSSPPSPRQSRATLDDLHREAFTSLRQSLAQSGEGFLRRMREWEQHRANMESSKALMLGAQEKGRDRRRARRRRTSHTDHRTGGIPASYPHDDSYLYPADISHPAREPESAYGTFPSGQGDSDVEDDMLVDIIGHPFSLTPAERKSRSVSLGRSPVDVPGSPEPFAVELAESERYASAHYTTTFDFPVTYSDTRSSSPFSLGNTSDDESSIGSRSDHPHSGFSSPHAMSNSVDWSVSTQNQTRVTLRSGENTHHSSPCASPHLSSPCSSHTRLRARRHLSIQSLDDTSMHKHSRLAAVSEITTQAPQTASDKALAALVLALASGSGSLADYGHVREAQGELAELEAGALWE